MMVLLNLIDYLIVECSQITDKLSNRFEKNVRFWRTLLSNNGEIILIDTLVEVLGAIKKYKI